MIKMLGGGATLLAHTELIDVSNPDKAGQVDARREEDGTWVIDVIVADAMQGGRASQTYEQTFGLRRQGN